MIMFFFQTIQGERVDFQFSMDSSIDSAQYAVGNAVGIYFNTGPELADRLREKYGDRVNLLTNYDLNGETVLNHSVELNFTVLAVKHLLDEDTHYASSVMELLIEIDLVPATPLDEQAFLDLAAHRQEQRKAGV